MSDTLGYLLVILVGGGVGGVAGMYVAVGIKMRREETRRRRGCANSQ